MARIVPMVPPYEPDVREQLDRLMPGGAEPIALFRTFVKNLPMARGLGQWGSYYLSRQLCLSVRDREIIIDRTCARTGCEYEWGVHIAIFADRAALSPAQVTSLTHGGPADVCWTEERDRLLIAAVDSLHDTNDVPDALWADLYRVFTEPQLLDLFLLTGWYHAISYVARTCRLPLEPGTPTFASVAPAPVG